MKQSSGSTRARARANRPNRATGTGIGTPAAAASSLRRSSSRRGNSLDATTATTTATGGILATLSMNNNEEEDDDGRGSTNARITKKKTLLRKRNKKPLAIESSSSDSENNENSASENSEKEATNSHDASTGSDINGNQKQTNSKENRSTYYSVDDSKSDYDMSDDDHDDNNNDDTNNCKPTPERSRNTTGSSSMNDMSSNNSSSQSAERTTTTNNNNHAVQKTLFATAQPKRRGLASQTTKTTRAKPRNPKTNITSSGSSSDAVSLQDSNDSEPEQEESLEEEENEEEDTASHCRSSSNANNSSHESISSSSSSSSSVLLTKDDDSDESDYNPNADSDEEEDDVDEKQQQSKDCNVVGGGGNVGCSNGSVASEKDNDDDNLDPDLVVQDQDELHCFARPETDRSPEEQLLADGNASPDNSHTTETGDDDDDETLDPDLVIQDQDELRCFARTESTRSPEELQVVDNASPDTSKKDKSFNDSHITEKDDDKNPDPDFADLDQDELHCFESPESTRSPPELRKDGNASPDETCSTNNDEYDKENCIHDKSLFHTQHQPNEVDTSKELKDGCNSNQARLSTFGDGDEHCSMLEKKVASDSPLRKKSSAENLSPFSGDRPIGNEPSMDVEVYLDNDATDCDSQSDIDDEEWIAEIVASDDDSENGTVNDSINEPPFPSHDAKPQQGSHASVSLSSQIGPTEEQLVQTSVPSLVTEKVKSTNDTTLNLLSPVNLEFTNTVTKDGATCKVNNTDDLPLLHDQATLRTSLQQDEMDCLPNASISSCHTSRPNDCIVSVVCDELRALAIGNEATRLPETQKRSTECLDVRSCLLGDFTLTSQVQHGVGSASKGSGTKDREVRVQRYRREGSVKRGKWKFGTKIGSGAFGVVHIGMNMETGALMAVKSLKLEPGAMKDAKREIQLLKSLQHENIVRYLGAEMDSKYLHIFQEWVPAGSVTTMLAKFGPFPLPVVRNYLEQILRGIEYLHDNSIMHRDVKGSNILVNDFGIIKLADFGASKRFVQLKSDMMLSLTVRGTPYFMAPEVFQEKYSTKADIWSVGCVVVQMVNGSPPWKCLGLTNPVSLYNHISSTTDLPYIDANGHYVSSIGRMENQSFELLQRLLEGCFQRLPEKRPSACDLLGNAFFAGDHSMSVEDLGDECKSLFSPDPTIYSRVGTSPIGANLSPIRPPTTRRNSIDASTRARFLSPPLPRSSKKKSSSLSPLMSPVRDSTNWPAWALKKILPIDQPYEATQKISLDSLVYSDDGNSVQAGYSRRSLSPGTISPIGVSFLSTHESPSSL